MNKIHKDFEYYTATPSMGLTFVDKPSTEWRCELFGCGNSIVLHPKKVPCRFWRWMQWLAFGNKWIKNNA